MFLSGYQQTLFQQAIGCMFQLQRQTLTLGPCRLTWHGSMGCFLPKATPPLTEAQAREQTALGYRCTVEKCLCWSEPKRFLRQSSQKPTMQSFLSLRAERTQRSWCSTAEDLRPSLERCLARALTTSTFRQSGLRWLLICRPPLSKVGAMATVMSAKMEWHQLLLCRLNLHGRCSTWLFTLASFHRCAVCKRVALDSAIRTPFISMKGKSNESLMVKCSTECRTVSVQHQLLKSTTLKFRANILTSLKA